MDLDWLKDFLALAESRNFSRAADARHVSQPAFSRRIRSLEDWIGTPLFVRGVQGVSPTAAGAELRPLVEKLLRDLEAARRETLAVGRQDRGSLSIAATHALSFTFFPGWIRRHTRIETLGAINLLSDSMEGCEQIMLAGEVQFLLCHHHAKAATRFDADRFESVQVGEDTLVPVCAGDASGKPHWTLPGSAAQPVRLLAYSKASGLGRILQAHRSASLAIGPTQTSVTSHLAATLHSMARDGQGVAWLPLSLVEDDLRSGRLLRAGDAQFDIRIEIRLFRSVDQTSRAASELWRWLTSECG